MYGSLLLANLCERSDCSSVTTIPTLEPIFSGTLEAHEKSAGKGWILFPTNMKDLILAHLVMYAEISPCNRELYGVCCCHCRLWDVLLITVLVFD